MFLIGKVYPIFNGKVDSHIWLKKQIQDRKSSSDFGRKSKFMFYIRKVYLILNGKVDPRFWSKKQIKIEKVDMILNEKVDSRPEK